MYLYTIENLKASRGDYEWVLVSARDEDDVWKIDPRNTFDREYLNYRWPEDEQYKRVTYIGVTHLPAGIMHIDQCKS